MPRPVLDQAAFDPRQPGVASSRSGFVGHDDVIVVNVGHGPSLVGVDPLRKVAEGQCLEVEHQVATDHRVVEPGEQEEAGCLHGPAGQHDGVGRLGLSLPLGVDPLHTGGAATLDEDARHKGVGPQFGPTGQKGSLQRRHRVPFGVDGAAVIGAEPAVVAGRPTVVGDRVASGGGRVGVVAEPFGGCRGEHRAVHRSPRRHWIGTGAPGRERVGAGLAGDADEPLRLGVVRLELVVAERPVGDRCTLDGAELGELAEVVFPKARELSVGVDSPAAHGGRQVVDVAHVQPVAVLLAQPEGPWLEPGIGSEEVAPPELDLVVRILPEQSLGVVEVDETVAASLEDQYRTASRGEDVGRRRPAGPRSDHDHVEISTHGPLTSASV